MAGKVNGTRCSGAHQHHRSLPSALPANAKRLYQRSPIRILTMDGNRDDAERCLHLAATALKSNDLAKATRLLQKSRRMYPLPDQQARFEAALKLHIAATASKTRASSSHASSRAEEERNSTGNGDDHDLTEEETKRQPSSAMLAAVRTVNKIRHKSHYEVLGVARDADDAVVKRAYRKLALRLHPDRNLAQGADEAFKRVGQAFVVLSDPERRSYYNQFGTDGPEHQPMPRRRKRRNARPPREGATFDDYDYVRQEMSADELFEFLFQAAGRGGGGFATQGFGPEGFFTTTRGDTQREYAEYVASEDSFCERFKPMILMFLVISLAMLFAQDNAQQPFSLFQTNFHSRKEVSMNNVRYYTAPNLDLSQDKVRRRLEWNVDMAALEEYSNLCRKEAAREEFLLRQSRRWLIGREEKRIYREKYERFEKRGCRRAWELNVLLQQQKSH